MLKSLIALRSKTGGMREGGFRAPVWAPYFGLVASLGVVAGVIVQTFA